MRLQALNHLPWGANTKAVELSGYPKLKLRGLRNRATCLRSCAKQASKAVSEMKRTCLRRTSKASPQVTGLSVRFDYSSSSLEIVEWLTP